MMESQKKQDTSVKMLGLYEHFDDIEPAYIVCMTNRKDIFPHVFRWLQIFAEGYAILMTSNTETVIRNESMSSSP